MFAAAAARMGIQATLATDRCDHLDDPWADRAIPIKFQHPDTSLETLRNAYAQAGPFTAIVGLGDRVTSLTAAFAQEARLPYHPPQSVETAGNKFLTKEAFRDAGLRVPNYRLLSVNDIAVQSTFPCVLKPIGLTGSRGVIRANNSEEFRGAFARIQKLLAADREIQDAAHILVEDYVPGVEVAIEGLVTNGRLQVLAIFDKPDPLEGPFFEETIYVTPSRHAPDVQQVMGETVQRGVTALGLTQGPIHAELRYNDDGAWLLEIAARPIGGYCARALQFTGGIGLEELVLRHALGEDTAGFSLLREASGVMMIPIPKAGVYRGVAGEQEAQAVPNMEAVMISASPGQHMKTYPEATSYLGFLFARGDTPGAVETALRQAHGKLSFDIATQLL
jgi:biotin carboxylase